MFLQHSPVDVESRIRDISQKRANLIQEAAHVILHPQGGRAGRVAQLARIQAQQAVLNAELRIQFLRLRAARGVGR